MWMQDTLTASSGNAGSYVVCCGRLYCAFLDASRHIALSGMNADRSWTKLPRGGPATGGTAPAAIAAGTRVLVMFTAADGSRRLLSTTFDPASTEPAWSPARPVGSCHTVDAVGLAEHAGRVWCAYLDARSEQVEITSGDGTSWEKEPTIGERASGAPALVEIAGRLHCLFPADDSTQRVVDTVLDDATRTWSRPEQQPNVSATAGVAACGVDRGGYLVFGRADAGGDLAVTRYDKGRWQPAEPVGMQARGRPTIAQFGTHIYIAGRDQADAGIVFADRSAATLADWMKDVPDDRALGALSIPGTHDSCALYGGPIAQTQTMSLADQFAAGVRWFDIRLALRAGALETSHGIIDERVAFVDVLQSLTGCLTAHPGEVIFMSVKNESGSDKAAFAAQVRADLHRHAHDLLWSPTAGSVSMPTLGELRTKLVVLARSHLGRGVGLDLTGWPASSGQVEAVTPSNADFAVAIEDDWDLRTLLDLPNKWTAVQSALTAAGDDQDSWHVTFTSASSSLALLWPIVAAEGLWQARGINTRLAAWLSAAPPERGLGTVVLDFPGFPQLQLCSQIVARNQH